MPPRSKADLSQIISLIEGELAFDACRKNTLENILF